MPWVFFLILILPEKNWKTNILTVTSFTDVLFGVILFLDQIKTIILRNPPTTTPHGTLADVRVTTSDSSLKDTNHSLLSLL